MTDPVADVGAIVPVRAPAPWLGEALEAVLVQQPAPAAVVVVDDASPEPVRLDAAHTARSILVRRERAGGAPAARDTALARLDTEWLALADADDVWRPDRLAAQLDAVAARRDVALCFGPARIVDGEGRPTGERWERVSPELTDPARLAALIYEVNLIPTSSVLVRREAVLAAGGFDGPPPCEDQDLWLRLLGRGAGFLALERELIDYRRHPAQLSADIAALAEGSRAVHEAHAGLVSASLARRMRAHDLVLLARGRVRQRRYREARAALAEAAAVQPPRPRERVLRALLAVPGLRAALGRRAPYRG
jgi:glycosyltransferase involved in cell wall biosynthesis